MKTTLHLPKVSIFFSIVLYFIFIIEILEFGEYLGMQLPEDLNYLYIAKEGLKAPLSYP